MLGEDLIFPGGWLSLKGTGTGDEAKAAALERAAEVPESSSSVVCLQSPLRT